VVLGIIEARRIVDEFKPQAIFATGGYVCFPAVVAGWLRGVPSLLHLPDIVPGLAVQALAPIASRVALSFPESKEYFTPKKSVVTGYPVRQEIISLDKVTAREELGINPEERLLLVLGGSRGAHNINLAVSQTLPQLLKVCQLIHIAGYQDEGWLREEKERLPQGLQERYRIHAYLHEEMAWAVVAADLALSRAGASTLGEFPAAGLPSILVPYPYAAGHQERNANYMVERGAAVKINDSDLKASLLPLLERLFADVEVLAQMAKAARSLAQPEAAQRMVNELRTLIDE
jgi:UDP-N-acetylglucosamine--N-acetylmuramyl-(pentapeptide) pyrophosphoryl-undecaprenol N-acetylglucosamine transferase